MSSKGRKTHPLTWAGAALIIGAIFYYSVTWNHQASLPVMPVAVKFRQAVLGSGYVLEVQNTSDKPLQLMASLSHPAINDSKRFDLFIKPHGHTDVSRFDGWITQPGDHITLENSNFQPWSGSIP
jgi:hypothetical protein